MKTVPVILLFVMVSLALYAEQPERDSIRRELAIADEDTARVILLYRLAGSYLSEETDSAFTNTLQGLTLSRMIKFRRGEMLGKGIMGKMLFLKGNYPDALKSNLEALAIGEELNDQNWIGEVCANIASIYFYQKDFPLALSYLRKMHDIGLRIREQEFVQVALENIGAVYILAENYDSALLYTQKAYSQAIEIKKPVYNLLLNLGHIYYGQGNPTLALEHFRAALPEIFKEGSDYYLWEAYLGMAKVFEKIGQMDSALYYARNSLAISRQRKYLQGCLDASTYLTAVYKEAKMPDSAFYYSEEAKAANDSLFSQQKMNQLQSLTLAERLRQKEREDREKIAQEERKHNLQYAAIAIGIIGFIILFLLLSHSIIVNKGVIRFLAALSLLILFEFINLLLHPFIVDVTHHSPILILGAMVSIAALLIPIHHKLEHWMTEKLIAKNNRIRLAAAKRTIAELEGSGAA